MICLNKIANRITFKIKTRYYLERLMFKTIKLLGNTKSNLNKDKNNKNVSHLEINEVALIHCHFVNNLLLKT